MIDRILLGFARFAIRLASTRFSPENRRVWSVRVDPWLIGKGPGAAELGLYLGDPDLARKSLAPVFRMVVTDEQLTVLLKHVETARRMRTSMRQG